MSKAVLISIRPKWCEKIVLGEKTIEVRKTRPKLETPFKAYIYCTSGRPDLNIPISPERLMQDYLDTGSMQSLNCPLGNGKVIGEFTCDRIDTILPANEPYGIYDIDDDYVFQTCLEYGALWNYGNGQTLYGWHISSLKIYDEPKELGEFTGLRKTKFGMEHVAITRPFQSWGYVEELP
jgi:predicted transcriptional regulator